jgi:hypothetical protein
LYGYSVHNAPLPPFGDIKDTVTVKRTSAKHEKRRIVQSTLGCHIQGLAMPHPDPDCPDTVLGGICKRSASKFSDPDRALLRKFKGFVKRWLSKNLTPLPFNEDVSFETWLSKTRYTEVRKQQLRDVMKRWPCLSKKLHSVVKSFIKDETYPSYKHARGIMSRHDRFKCEFGPVIKAIEERVYKLHWFIKHVPVAERPAYIKKLLHRIGAKYYATDYTAFESLFVKQLMDCTDRQLFEYMIQNLPNRDHMLEMFSLLDGVNHLQYKYWTVDIPATRMSGEMSTSLFNGFANLMFFLFVAEESGVEADGVVEGDDGLFSVAGNELKDDLFLKLGLNIKLEVHQDLCSASFCGIIFDDQDCINVTDPREVLASFGWTTNNYLHAAKPLRLDLLRSKALSYAHQYPGCPIISSLAKYGLRMTRGRDIRHFVAQKLHTSMWEREQLLDVINKRIPDLEVGVRTRLLVEKLYKIPVETQLSVEKYLDELDELQPLDIPCFDLMAPREWSDYFRRFQAVGDRQDVLHVSVAA